MNTKRITLALIAAVLAIAVVAAVRVHFAVGVEGLFGFGAVVAIIAMAVTDYRLTAPRMLGK